MSSVPQVVRTLDEMRKFLNDKGVMEIVDRRKNGRIKEIIRVSLDDLSRSKEQELLKEATNLLNKNIHLSEHTLERLGIISRVQNIGLVLNGLNLAASCAGFAVMYAKLNKMEANLSHQIHELQKTVKKGQDVWQKFEFNKVLSEHTNMLDCQRKQKPYSEDKLRELIDSEYVVLTLLISAFQKNVSDDHGDLIFSIYSLLSMLSASLLIFDEVYYYNNHEVLGDQNCWHTAHDKWMSVFDTVSSVWFVELLQDYATFEAELSTGDVDVYYLTLLDQAEGMKMEIEDNQELIIKLGDIDTFREYKNFSVIDIAETVKEAFMDAGRVLDKSVVMDTFQNTMQHAAMI